MFEIQAACQKIAACFFNHRHIPPTEKTRQELLEKGVKPPKIFKKGKKKKK